MGPEKPLPYNEAYFSNEEDYIDSLINFITTDELHRTLCGGVHILDFFTSDPELYTRILPQEWRDFCHEHEVMDVLDLFTREDLAQFSGEARKEWRRGPAPPASLLEYIEDVRKHLLERSLPASRCAQNRTQKKLARHVAVGMNVKKVHEVGLYAGYIDRLASSLQDSSVDITHLIDFGSGQNYLGRALASEPYIRDIVAIESKLQNQERAKDFDVQARVVGKQRVMRNKKAFRNGEEASELQAAPERSAAARAKWPEIERQDAVRYVEHRIQDADLTEVLAQIPGYDKDSADEKTGKGVMVISLHSCGNLIHHGLRSLTLNSAVKAVALVGCCYNLLTERLGSATYKLPELRPTTHQHPRLRNGTSSANELHFRNQLNDPHGFPMSARFCAGHGVTLNITSRMMAVQAPQNWGPTDSAAFFTRHFYRALLQRLFLDHGIVGPPSRECVGGVSPAGHSSGGTPITIGSLRKGCYESFVKYVRGALSKICAEDAENQELARIVRDEIGDITDEVLELYERHFAQKKKELSVIWSLMAFSAGVVEAAIVVDRYLWLTEQEEVGKGRAWVEAVFEYQYSPRNLVVVGIKKETD